MAEENKKLVLWGYWRSSCSYRVRIALNLKGLEYEYKAVHLRLGEQKKSEYAALNPNQTVPTLEVDGKFLTQSLAIIEYIDEIYNQSSPLLPSDHFQKAEVRSLAEIIACDIQPLQNLRIMGKHSSDPEKKTQWAKEVISEGLARFEIAVSKTAGTYCYGDNVTLVDLCLVPQVYNAIRFDVDFTALPTTKRIYDNLAELDAFKRAHPSVQPDAEDDAPK